MSQLFYESNMMFYVENLQIKMGRIKIYICIDFRNSIIEISMFLRFKSVSKDGLSIDFFFTLGEPASVPGSEFDAPRFFCFYEELLLLELSFNHLGLDGT